MVYISASPKQKEPTSPESDTPLSLAFLQKKKKASSDGIVQSNTQVPSPPPLIRKKSGELVKSSLRLNYMNGSSRSMPTTPTYNKSVHFGVDVDVRYFDEREKPTAVSADGSPVLRGRHTLVGSARFDGLENMSETDDDIDDDDDDDEDEDAYDISWDLFPVNFAKIKYNEKFREGSKVFLEKVMLDDDEKCIIGSIAVKNLSFQKDIHIRYTFDQWRTVIEIEAAFTNEVTKILKRASFDRFVFKIPLRKFEMLPDDRSEIAFCIRYRFSHEEVWDNNHFKNYRVILTRNRRVKGSRSAKFSLNDYFTTDLHAIQPPASVTSDYFTNYENLKSPETPRVLKMDDPILSLPEFKSLDNISQSVAQMSLLSDDSNVDLMKYKENIPNSEPAVPKEEPIKMGIPTRKNKPAINSKSYQELLDSYCFFTSEKTAGVPMDDMR
jgi:hypothetical protein